MLHELAWFHHGELEKSELPPASLCNIIKVFYEILTVFDPMLSFSAQMPLVKADLKLCRLKEKMGDASGPRPVLHFAEGEIHTMSQSSEM